MTGSDHNHTIVPGVECTCGKRHQLVLTRREGEYQAGPTWRALQRVTVSAALGMLEAQILDDRARLGDVWSSVVPGNQPFVLGFLARLAYAEASANAPSQRELRQVVTQLVTGWEAVPPNEVPFVTEQTGRAYKRAVRAMIPDLLATEPSEVLDLSPAPVVTPVAIFLVWMISFMWHLRGGHDPAAGGDPAAGARLRLAELRARLGCPA